MKLLSHTDIPQGYFYYRNVFAGYQSRILEHFAPFWSQMIVEDGNFGRIKQYFWGLFSILRFEKTDIKITPELLQKYGAKRGIIYISPWRLQRPQGNFFSWIPLGYFFAQNYHHSTRSAFCILDREEYFQKWKSNARNHRKKILRLQAEGKVSIQKDVSLEEFLKVYERIKTPHNYKRYLIKKLKFLTSYSTDIRLFLACVDGIPLAGACFLDHHPTSTYFVAFQEQEAKKYHLWLALLDTWFEGSYKKWFLYLDLDHIRNRFDPLSYRGYTTFKSEIADYELRFEKVWMKIFF